ncbi:hypothetical protein B005_3476 [Nocardiopsis alba ATCC BAA-2165]|uniref:Uncharacterized protein n=1 Tax=Nocardiopsis alba (strain ATCC BAA-2165 / BE74) TaxID=1205910 RepID=J7KYC0_NOCAA|nr:hypothetical protein B005_3476 [Nocardiopsis alba ATCC BAA-2165]
MRMRVLHPHPDRADPRAAGLPPALGDVGLDVRHLRRPHLMVRR